MGLSPREDLDIVILVYYVPAFFLSLFVVARHGFGRQLGWIFLSILGLLRIIGASTGIAVVSKPSQGLFECSYITSSIGISPLLLTTMGIVSRVNQGMKGHGVPTRFHRIITLPVIVGLVLAIVGGIDVFSSDPSSVNSGHHLVEAAVMMFLLGLLAVTAAAGHTVKNKWHILDGENRLLNGVLLSLPFLAVRIVYSIITAFDHNSTTFSIVSTTHAAVIVQAIMSILMEFIVVAIYLSVGLVARVIPREMVQDGYVQPPKYNAANGVKHERTSAV